MRVAVDGAELYVEVVGEGPPLVAIHGGPGPDGSALRYLVAPLADTARVVAPDLRGHGRSDLGTPDDWNLERWARDVKELSDALELERPVVLGISFGGAVVQKYASMFPDHPRGLVLVSTGPRFPRMDELVERIREIGGDEAAEIARRDAEHSTEETLADWQRVVDPLMSRNPSPDPELARIYERAQFNREVNLHFAPQLKTLDLRPELSKITCPVLVLAGAHDPMAPVALSEEFVDALANARVVALENAAHSVFKDAPDDALRVIREFVRELS